MPIQQPRRQRQQFMERQDPFSPFGGPPPGLRPLPKPRTAREYAFAILDEHKQTGAFISDLIDDHVDRSYSGFLKQPPLAKLLGKRPKEPRENKHFGPAALNRLDRGFVMELASGVARRQVTLDAILRQYLTKQRSQIEPRLWLVLQIGVYQLVMMSGVPVHAAVFETVELGRYAQQPEWCGLLNGVLRTIARDIEGYQLVDDKFGFDAVPIQPHRLHGDVGNRHVVYRHLGRPLFHDPAVERRLYIAEAFALPMWLLDRWAQRYDEDALLEMAEWFSVRQPHTLRVNSMRTTREDLLKRFSDQFLSVTPACFGLGNRPDSFWYDGPLRIVDLPGFLDGDCSVQDETAMAASELLAPQPGERVLDLCAAPGTKTAHLGELMKNEGHIVAADVDHERLAKITDNAQRLGLTIIEPITIPLDATELPLAPFDAVLVDAPCSNTGVLGKRPEVRSRLRPNDLTELAAIQLRLAKMAANLLKPGGRMVYSTCSIEPEENAGIVQQLLLEVPEMQLVSSHEFAPGKPTDGGYQALLRKV